MIVVAWIKKLFFPVVIWYCLCLAGLFFGQRYLEYFPDRSYPGKPADHGVPQMKEVRVKTEDSLDLLAWFAPPKKQDGRIVVLFHGNGGNIAARAGIAPYFTELGYGFMLCEYRGYGGNKGTPTEDGFYKDGRACLKWLETEGYSPAQFVLYGESMGTGVAVQLAMETQPRILILQSPFSSAAELAKSRYFLFPVETLMKDKFESFKKISKVRSSLLIVHGDEDSVVPISFSHRLFEFANHPKQFNTINGAGHNDLYVHHAGHVIREWLDAEVMRQDADVEMP